MDKVSEICINLRNLLEASVKKNLSDGILLSGGLDTSIIALIASNYKPLTAITVELQDAPAPDVKFAKLMADRLEFEQIIHTFDYAELYEALPNTIKTANSFDPMEIRNSVVIYIGLREAKENGLNTILTGDGADELFAGYSYMFNFENQRLAQELKKLASVMEFSSGPLAQFLGLEARIPFLEPKFKSFAISLKPHFKVHRNNDLIQGKWILRKAYEEMLPSAITWRTKTPIEVGSGSTILPTFFNQKIPDDEFQEKKQKYLEDDGVTIRGKEQLFYYEIYRSVVGKPRPVDKNRRTCPQCNSNVKDKTTYCRTCGAYPI